MQTLINSIRATGATQPILVPGADWANDMSGWLSHRPTDPQHALAASWHSYNHQPCAVLTCWTNVIQPLAAQVPVVVAETGDDVCNPPSYAPTFIPWADSHGLSYFGWTFNPWSYCHDVLITDWSGTPSANWGQWFYTHLRSFPPINPIFH
jgi:hypothetical protein